MSDIINEAIILVKPLIDKKKLSNHISIPGDLPKIYCDQTRIRQVILNLVSNAARYTEIGGITIALEIQNQQVVVGVSDTGPGITPEELDQIFEPFYQGSNNFWREKGGSGLGLSISKQFVELHGGQMWLKSELEIGSSFLFSLPISTPLSPISSSDGWIREDWVWYENSFKSAQPFVSKESLKPRIVLYDETDGINSELSNFQEGLNFCRIKDINEAVSEVKENLADLVMINTLSPDHLLDLIEKTRLQTSGVPIIGSCLPKPVKLTCYSENVQYLSKPVTISKLKDTILKIDRSVEKVLIIDDDPEVLGLFSRLIKVCDNKVEVLTASDGIVGLEQVDKFKPDLILLDLVMPRMNGWQFLELLKSNDKTDNLPVIVISARDILEQPLKTNLLIASINDGLSIKKLLGCSLYLTPFLMRPDALLDLVHLKTADA
ncbi:MAG: response regulator [Bacteroidetes bacterium]|nr:response regulator [Bacteroidota bacterium]